MALHRLASARLEHGVEREAERIERQRRARIGGAELLVHQRARQRAEIGSVELDGQLERAQAELGEARAHTRGDGARRLVLAQVRDQVIAPEVARRPDDELELLGNRQIEHSPTVSRTAGTFLFHSNLRDTPGQSDPGATCPGRSPKFESRRNVPALQPDLFTTEFQEDPYPSYAWMRERAPVYREPRYGNFVISRFTDAFEVLRDHATFSNARGQNPSGPQAGVPSLASSDPPLHDQLRALVSRAFTPRRVAESEPRIRRLIAELLAALPGEDFDLVAQIALPLPVVVIAELLGVAPERGRDFRRWSDALVGLMEKPPTPSLLGAAQEMLAYFREVLALRRNEPRDDLVSALLAAEIDGRRLTALELESFCLLLLVAGNETTTNLISNQVHVLAGRPDLWKRLREEPALVPAALEETLRWDSPVQNLGRDVTREVALHGVPMRPGDRLLVSYGAANRDEREFPGAEEYRIDRAAPRHLGFGFGVHFCLGAGLARLEARVALEGLLARFREIAPGEGHARRTHSTVIRGFESLPVSAH